MSKHRSPEPPPTVGDTIRRLNTSPTALRTVAGCAAVLTVAAVAGGANSIGDDFTPAAHATATPPAEDVGQRGMRGLPTPARVFPSDINAPDYPIGERSPFATISPVPSRTTPSEHIYRPAATGSAEATTGPANATPDETITEQAAEQTADPSTTAAPPAPETEEETPVTTTATTTTESRPTDVGGLINELLGDMP